MSAGPNNRAQYDKQWGTVLVSAPPPPRRQVSRMATLPSQLPQPAGFLAIPLSVRFAIYRLLLRSDQPLTSMSRNLGLSPAILGTCRQVLDEGRAVLYGENVWLIDIGVFRTNWDDSVLLEFIGRPTSFDLRPICKFLRRFKITITMRCHEDIPLARNAVGRLADFLSTIPQLDCLNITLLTGVPLRPRIQDIGCLGQVLERLSQVRPVGSVVFEGVPPFYNEYLTRSITKSPLSDIQKLYNTVCDLAHLSHLTALGQAYDALASGNAEQLNILVEEIRTTNTDRLERDWQALLASTDGDAEKDALEMSDS